MTKALTFALPLSMMMAGGGAPAARAAELFYPAQYQSAVALDQYQGPDGKYRSQSDFIRSLNGTPCGFECERRAAARHDGNLRRRKFGSS